MIEEDLTKHNFSKRLFKNSLQPSPAAAPKIDWFVKTQWIHKNYRKRVKEEESNDKRKRRLFLVF